jgi:proton-translocating NADH-quinone oxidoreductase chain L
MEVWEGKERKKDKVMYSLILFIPLLGFLYASLLGFYFGREGISLLVCGGQIIALAIAAFIYYEIVLCRSVVVIQWGDWIALDVYVVTFGLLFDSLTCTMLLLILVISTAVHIYSLGYMAEDPYLTRFLGYLSLFTFFMIFLVTADNFLQMFIGWEGVGLCSYLLINFWHKRLLANKAAIKAMVINRMADIFFMFAIILIWLTFKTVDFVVVFELVPFMLQEKILFLGFWVAKIDLICFFLFIGAVGKSAQLGLHLWLPDAMEGPTPVSALLHAATMVTAGIFLLLRCSPMFEFSPKVLFFVALVGVLTAWFFSLIGAFQYDIKKIIAYSTCSQLGYMFFSCGISNYQLAIFHLFNHGFFKALLFLSAGSVIHALFGEQDIRRMGGLVNYLPFTFFCFLVGSLALAGFPFLTGFYSKDLILELSAGRYLVDGNFIFFLSSSAAFFTAFYSTRLIFFVFFHEPNYYRIFDEKIQENGWEMSAVLAVLCFLSIFAGYIFSEAFVGWGTYTWVNALEQLPGEHLWVHSAVTAPTVKNIPLVCSFSAVLCFFGFEYLVVKEFACLPPAYGNALRAFWERSYWLSPLFYFAGFFNAYFNGLFEAFFSTSYKFNTKILDKGFWELFGPKGLAELFWDYSYYLIVTPRYVLFFIFILFFLALAMFIHVLLSWKFVFVFIARQYGLFMLVLFLFLLDLLLED